MDMRSDVNRLGYRYSTSVVFVLKPFCKQIQKNYVYTHCSKKRVIFKNLRDERCDAVTRWIRIVYLCNLH